MHQQSVFLQFYCFCIVFLNFCSISISILFFYFLWLKGTLSDSENILKGKVEIPNLSEEHDPEDVDVSQRPQKYEIMH